MCRSNLYHKRVQQVDSIIQMLSAKPMDFSKPDDIVTPFPGYVANEQAMVQRWQHYLKWQVLDEIADRIDH